MTDATRLIVRMYLGALNAGIVVCGSSLLSAITNGGSLSSTAWAIAGISGVVVVSQHIIAALSTPPIVGK